VRAIWNASFNAAGRSLDVGDEIVVLRHGHADGADVSLLKPVTAEQGNLTPAR
jgi:hypothetical protein